MCIEYGVLFFCLCLRCLDDDGDDYIDKLQVVSWFTRILRSGQVDQNVQSLGREFREYVC